MACCMMAFGMYHVFEESQEKAKEESAKEYEAKSIADKVSDASNGVAMVLLQTINMSGSELKKLQPTTVEE